ncbi:uncharacterized protein CcaverHIS019_0603050 [Cutaneotrichosporon cavernicola]|uniref:CNH domain-containing protein n=1 Tax=Cutaneotrichosporon cavernicola TaxID=279322 RepID=A0AA48L833_9TREE|nr:uncharacterized protein CcaverHIS019_0603050 [Cutaneotrichosporon cavernicola]BEI93846.1 hypothetical protein CcaverHIS019_0603050 [Cutaneotrichosporon cavernicola]BEJ01623.1 hypothetical protein CcaverHIS631_0603050 [Cutaneotrichosporon cavernicola]BEJ09391.1 hypothetical protein CcaverHIS641_0603060 [Cutaneotrichosporon cavernicola]
MGSHALHPLLAAKARITTLHQHDGTLYAGCADGSVRYYDGAELKASYQLSRRQIDALAVLPVSGLLVVLAGKPFLVKADPDQTVSLYKLDHPSRAKVLTQARYAQAFAATTYMAPGKPSEGSATAAKTRRDLLVVGCSKKVVVYGAGARLGEAWELTLPHTPRAVIFPAPVYADLPGAVHLLYSPSASTLLHIKASPAANRLSATDLPMTGYPASRDGTRPAVPDSGWGRLGGFMRGAALPVGTRTVGGEVALVRDDLGVFFSSEGNFTRDESLHWPTVPEALAFSNPFLYSVLPAAAAVAGQPASLPTIQVHLAPTLTLRDTITFPAPTTGSLSVAAVNVGATSTDGRKSSKLLLVSTPTDRTLALEGSTIWEVRGTDIGEQVDELVREGRVMDAIGLVEAVGDTGLEETQRLPRLRILNALAQFARGEYQPALETFTVFNVNPAKVIALYPRTAISGNLAVPREEWMKLFGAVEGARLEPEVLPVIASPKPSVIRNAHLALARKKSNDTIASVASTSREHPDSPPKIMSPPPMDDETLPRKAVDELIYYLSDRRQKLGGAIPALKDPLPAEADLPSLSEVHAAMIHDLPDGPLIDLDPEQLLRTAQVVYTSLLKVYLVARPSLVGSLCRIENWVDVAEVEPLLREKGRIDDLRDLYMQKGMHDKALGMLLEQAKEEDDPLDRYPPTVRYLEKLGPKHLQLIFDSSRWIFEEDPGRGLQIFTADEPEVDALPRDKVVAFLEEVDWKGGITYLEHVFELGDTSPELHDKLVELYLRRLKSATGSERDEALKTLLAFLNDSTHYRPYRLLSKLPVQNAPEAQAVLLGRLGKHDEALRLYIYTLKDYAAAEAYCARVHAKEPERGLFLHLLRLYLRPVKEEVLVAPALALVARHGKRMDARAVLDLLPPLVPVKELHDFFLRTLGDERARRNEHRITRGLLAARKAQAERLVVGLEVKRVRVTDQRICPQCQKRLGQSAIAVHAPRGEVTHLHCKDLFSERLARARA